MKRSAPSLRVAALAAALVVLAGGTASGGPKDSKVNAALSALHEAHAAHMARSSGLPFAPADARARVVEERVVIDAIADGDALALKAALASLGMQNIAVFGRVVSGELPMSAIPALEAVASLRFARPSYAMRRAGSVASQGDHAIRADVGRAASAVTGAGVQVGVLSDSYNCLGGASKDVASGDLPPVTVLQEISGCVGADDEGRALLQIVHDVAPGAGLSFASAFNGLAAFANNILALKANGARVLVDDIVYFSEPMFQDGLLSQAVDTVASQGVAYFSAAGNEARQSYQSAFRAGSTFANGSIASAPGAPHFFGGTAHNFASAGPADVMQRVTIPAGRTLTILFQWDAPFFSVSGGPGSPSDVDIYVLNAAGTQVVAASITGNVGGDPLEFVEFTNTGLTSDFNVMIVLFEGPAPGLMKYVHFSPSVTIQQFDTASGTIFGHANGAGAVAVGAASWMNTPSFGINPPLPEPYSSAGSTPILFDPAGHRLASPTVRAKPEIVAPDGVWTTFFGFPTHGDPFPSFPGTSAAAPHAAGVAALLLEKQPGLSPASIISTLENTAVDMGPPGFDFDTGFGLIQAAAALQAISGAHLSLGLMLNRQTASGGDQVQMDVTEANTGPGMTVDLYFIVQVPPALSAALGCPSGDAVLFLADAFASLLVRCVATAAPQSFVPLFRNRSIPGSLPPTTIPGFVGFPWPHGLAPGLYTFTVFATPPAAFADGFASTDISAFASAQLQSLP